MSHEHELLLFGQIPTERHGQLQQILAGISAMRRPNRLLERHVIFRPTSLPNSATSISAPKGGSQGVSAGPPKANQQTGNKNANADVYFIKLVKSVKEEDFGKSTDAMEVDDVKKTGESNGWQIQFRDTPLPGKRQYLMRKVQDTDVTATDAQGYVESLGYTYGVPSIQQGSQFIHENLVLTLYRILTFKEDTAPTSLSAPLPPWDTLTPLDPNDSWVLEARIRIEQTTPTLISQAETQLLSFQKMMKGSVDMIVMVRDGDGLKQTTFVQPEATGFAQSTPGSAAVTASSVASGASAITGQLALQQGGTATDAPTPSTIKSTPTLMNEPLSNSRR